MQIADTPDVDLAIKQALEKVRKEYPELNPIEQMEVVKGLLNIQHDRFGRSFGPQPSRLDLNSIDPKRKK